MLFDVNTAVGHWPFRKVPNNMPKQLRVLLDGKGIGGAAVANTHGLFYKNCHDANIELAEWIADDRDFFRGVATLNPTYPAWERDIRACREELGLAALRLAPQYHDYRLGCPESVAIAEAASELGMPILVPHRVVDVRQRHWLDTERTVGMDEIGALCRSVPSAVVIYTECSIGAGSLIGEDGSVRYPGLYAEMSRCGTADLPPEVAAERIIFGSGAPFKHITPAILKLRNANLTDEQRDRIGGANAISLLGPSDARD